MIQRQIDAIVMLGPPNRGSFWASLGGKLIKAVNASLDDMALRKKSFANNIPAPSYLPPVGIITGKYDGKVAFRNTTLPAGQPFHRITVNSTHPGLRDPRHTLLPILRFFAAKDF
ncbi:MAG: hypothetical protein MJ016_06865 [Victivallaceae bacterium]|nr:hypothetical protein [Victivallaceae bacterium]